MKIKNSEVEELATFLLDFKLKGTKNRKRNKFIKLLQNHLREMQEEHKEILNEFCKKDEKGEFKTIIKDGKSFYDIDDVEGFQREYGALMDDYLFIEVNEGNMDMLLAVKEIILNNDNEFSGKEALKYESYCEMFEEEFNLTV
jgi:hypothetical protein